VTDKTAGVVKIHDDVLADVAGYAALIQYGVVGMAAPNLRNGVAQLLSRDKLRKGVVITHGEDGLCVDLYVVVEYGTNLTEVARILRDKVAYAIECNTNVKPSQVEVHVQDVRVRA
jgi:uncharacterized alkaline shock family protein YloU